MAYHGKKNHSIAQQKTVASTPIQPDSGYSKIYAKDDNNWYYLDDIGIEHSFVTSEDINQPQPVVTFAQAATRGILLYNPVYNNGPLNDGVGATLTAASPGTLSDGSSLGKIDFTYTPVNGGVIVVWYENASTNPALNRQFTHGLYEITDTGSISTNYVLTRLAEFDESTELFPLQINITDGTSYLGKYFIQKTPSPIIGTDKLIFVLSRNQIQNPQIAFVDTATTTALPACTYTPGTVLTSLPGSGATLIANFNGALGTIGGLTAETSASSITGFTRVLVKDQVGTLAYQNGDYQVIDKGSPSTPWKLRRIQNWAGGFSRYTRFFLVSNTGSTQAGKLYFTAPNSPALTNATIGTAPINIVEYGGSGGGVIDVGSGTGSTVRISNSNNATCLYSTVSGGASNTSSSYYSTVSGGYSNTASGCFSNVSGGVGNTASGCYSAVGGGYANTASVRCSTIGGGYINTASNYASTVGGGRSNSASGRYSMVGGGRSNIASNVASTVSGGYLNAAIGQYATIGGGRNNGVNFDDSTIGGGYSNVTSAGCSVVGGGRANTASNIYSTVGGGASNLASGTYSTVSGGISNSASGCYSSISGGKCNNIDSVSPRSVISGGDTNVIISSRVATVAGGQANNICTASGGSVIGGGRANTASCYYSTISGGYGNIACTGRSTVGGGQQNTASGCMSTIGGGYVNVTSGYTSTVSGGRSNSASGCYSTIGGGRGNTSSGCYSNVGGGCGNTASGCAATILGGKCNTASGTYSIVSGAYSSTFSITGRRSHAGGQIATLGDAQISDFVLRRRTTDATSTVLTTDGGVGATSGNQLILQNNNSIAFEGIIVGKQSGSANSVMWKVEGLIVKGVNAASTTLSFSNVQVVQNTPGWGTPTLVANTTLGGLTVNVVGAALTNIQWTAVLKTTEVIYA